MKKKDLVSGIIILAYALFYLINSFSIKIFAGAGATIINSSSIPRLWGIVLIVLSAWLIIRGIKQGRKENSTSEADSACEKNQSEEHTKQRVFAEKKVIAPTLETVLVLIFYAVSIGTLGFILTTIIYLSFQIPILQPKVKRNYLISTALAIAFTLAVYFLFVYALNVPLPQGRIW